MVEFDPDQGGKGVPVEIGELKLKHSPSLSLAAPFIDPNPESIEWTKTNRVTVHEIPGFKDRTQLTSNETLWHLNISGVILTKDGRDNLKYIINNVGPYTVKTDFQELDGMYVANGRIKQAAGFAPNTFTYTLDLIEMND
jgi:hypothetical protein